MTGQSGHVGQPALVRLFRRWAQNLRLRHFLFACLLLSGIIPLLISSLLLIRQNRGILVDQEKEYLVRSAEALSQRLNDSFRNLRADLEQRGYALLLLAGDGSTERLLQRPEVAEFLGTFFSGRPAFTLQVLDFDGQGLRFPPRDLDEELEQALEEQFAVAAGQKQAVYGLVAARVTNDPMAVLSVPVDGVDGQGLVLESINTLEILRDVVRTGGEGAATVLLIDRQGQILWSEGGDAGLLEAVRTSDLLRNFAARPSNYTTPFRAQVDGQEREVEATVSRVAESGWGVVVLKPRTLAFKAVDKMVYNTLLSSILLVAMALAFAAAVARWVGKPIDRLTETSHEIAAGNFGRRVAVDGLSPEMADLAENFNRMSQHVEAHIEQLQEAAHANRELFLGSIRAFAAAIDAKDPYTRGHSERVAALSRVTARHLGLDEENQQRIWLGALLHDVGKIGVDDRILKKEGVLSPEDFEQMKLHTVIGAEIMERIGQLREIVPAIRWHHENWNGEGYPDGKRGEEIPLAARIVSVSDTFDAITTNRPYQQAYTLEFAVDTITRLTGTRFDAKVVTAFLKAFETGEVEVAMQTSPRPTEEIATMELLGETGF